MKQAEYSNANAPADKAKMVKQAAMAAALRKKTKQPKPDPSALGSG